MGAYLNHLARIARFADVLTAGVRIMDARINRLDAACAPVIQDLKKYEAKYQAEIAARRAVIEYLEAIASQQAPPTSHS